MSKFFLGFIVCLGMVIGCGAAGKTAVSHSNTRLTIVESSRFSYNSIATIIRDSKTGQEYICVDKPDAIHIIRIDDE